MLLTTFLLLGCLAFFLVIMAFIPLKVRASIIVWVLAFCGLVQYVETQMAIIGAAVVAAAYGWYLFTYGTYQEQQAAKKAEKERDELIEAIRREKFSLPPASSRGHGAAS